jgi:hypothetical protein
MAINPYTRPVQYQYKPLGLEAFAVPLSNMQQQYDKTTMDIENEDFDLSYLPYGTDPERAKELLQTVKSKRDELAQNLIESKNYKQAAQKLLRLRKLWSEDPELQALQSNYKTFNELDKKEKERVDKGDITRDQYLEWKNRLISDYTTQGGASFKASQENREGEYNPVGRIARLKDQSQELEKVRLEIAKAQPEKATEIFDMYGIPLSEDERVHIGTTWKYKNADEIARETEKYLRRYPGFTEWASEVADYDLWNISQNPEKYKQTANSLLSSYLQDSNDFINQQRTRANKGDKSAQSYLESADFKELQENQQKITNMINTGEYDENIVQNLFTNKHLDKVFGSQEVADILAYKNISKDHTFRKIGDGKGSGKSSDELGAGFFTPTTYEKFDISGIQKDRVTSGRNIYNILKETNQLADGVLGIVVRGKKGTKEYDQITKDPAAMLERQKEILTAYSSVLNNGGNYKDFYNRIKKLGASEKAAATIWKKFGENNGYAVQKLQKAIENSEYDYNNYINSRQQLQSLDESASQNYDYKNIINNQIGNIRPELYSMGNPMYTNEKLYRAFDPDSYSSEQYKKAGIKKPEGTSSRQTSLLTFNQVAKLHGYKSVQDAISKGYKFEGAPIEGSFESGKISVGGAFSKTYDIINYANSLKQQLLNEGLITNEQSYRYIGDKKVDKQMTGYFLQESDLSGFQPAYTSTQQAMPGFDEQGKLLPSTQFDFNATTKPKLVKHGNSLFMEVPIKYKNEDGETIQTTTVVKPKKGNELSFERLLNHIDEATSAEDADNLDRQTNDMIKVAKFDQRFKTNFSNPLVKGISVGEERGSQETVTSLPYGVSAPGVTIDIVKISTGDGGSTMKVALTNGTEKQFLKNPETGKDFYSSDAEAVKAFIAKQMQL